MNLPPLPWWFLLHHLAPLCLPLLSRALWTCVFECVTVILKNVDVWAFVNVCLTVPVHVGVCECANCQLLLASYNSAFSCPQDSECVNFLHSCVCEWAFSGWTKGQMGFSQRSLFTMSQTCVSERATHHWVAGQGQYRLKHFSSLPSSSRSLSTLKPQDSTSSSLHQHSHWPPTRYFKKSLHT